MVKPQTEPASKKIIPIEDWITIAPGLPVLVPPPKQPRRTKAAAALLRDVDVGEQCSYSQDTRWHGRLPRSLLAERWRPAKYVVFAVVRRALDEREPNLLTPSKNFRIDEIAKTACVSPLMVARYVREFVKAGHLMRCIRPWAAGLNPRRLYLSEDLQDERGFLKLPMEMVTSRAVPPAAVLVFGAIITYAGRKNHIISTDRELAELCGIDVEAGIRALKFLETKRFLWIIRGRCGGRGQGRQKSTYCLIRHKLFGQI